MNPVDDITITILVLLKSTASYVHHRIGHQRGKDAYKEAMTSAISILKEGIQNLDIVKTKIISLKDETKHLYKPTIFNKRQEEIAYYNIAIDQALEIVSKLEERFIVGMSDLEPRGFKNKGIVILSNEGIF